MWEKVHSFWIVQQELWTSVIEKFQHLWAWLCMAGLFALSFFEREIGGMNDMVLWLLKLQIADFVFGTYAGITARGKHYQHYRSDLGIRGIDKKASTWLYVWAAVQVDTVLGSGTLVRDTFIKLYAVHTIGSILEIWVILKWFGYEKIEKLLLGRLRDAEEWLISKLPGVKKNSAE